MKKSNDHIKNVFEESELERDSVVANFATTAATNRLNEYIRKGFTMDDERLRNCQKIS